MEEGQEEGEREQGADCFLFSSLSFLLRLRGKRLSFLNRRAFFLFHPTGHGGASLSESVPLSPLPASATSSRGLLLALGAKEVGRKGLEDPRAGACESMVSQIFSEAFHLKRKPTNSRERERERERERAPPPVGLMPPFLVVVAHPLPSFLASSHYQPPRVNTQALPAHAAKAVKAADKVAGMSTAQLVSLKSFFFCSSLVGMRAKREQQRKRP